MAEVLQEVAKLPNLAIKSIDNVIETGLKEDFELRFTVLGRDIGIRVEVSLLHKAAKPGN